MIRTAPLLAVALLAGCSDSPPPTLASNVKAVPIIDCVAFSPDGTALAAAFNTDVKVFDLANGSVRQTLTTDTQVPTLAWSPDGKMVAGGTRGKKVLVWEVASGKAVHTFEGLKAPVNVVAWAPDGNLLVVALGDQNPYADQRGNVRSEVRLFDPVAGKEVASLQNPGDTVLAVAFSPDGKRFATGAVDAKVRVWDAADRKPVGPAADHGAMVFALAFSADGKTILSGGLDNLVAVWAADLSGKPVRLDGLTDRVNALAVTPLGPVTASDDGSVRVWDVDTKAPRLTLLEKAPRMHTVAASRDGKAVAAGGGGGVVRVWDLASPASPRLELK